MSKDKAAANHTYPIGSNEWFENFDTTASHTMEEVTKYQDMKKKLLLEERRLLKEMKSQWTGGISQKVMPTIFGKFFDQNSKFYSPEYAEVASEIVASLPSLVSEQDTEKAEQIRSWSEKEAAINRILNDKADSDQEVRVPKGTNYRSDFEQGKALIRTWLGCITLHRVLTGIAGAPPQWRNVLPQDGSRTRGGLGQVLENHIRRTPAPELFIQSLFGVNAVKVFPTYKTPQDRTWGNRNQGLGSGFGQRRPAAEPVSPGIDEVALTAILGKFGIKPIETAAAPAPVQAAPVQPLPEVLAPAEPVFSIKTALGMLKQEGIPLPSGEVLMTWEDNKAVTDYAADYLEGEKKPFKEVFAILSRLAG